MGFELTTKSSFSKYVPDSAKVLFWDYETIGEKVSECARVLPSENESLGEHVSDSMDGCVVDELFPSHFIIRQATCE